MMRIGGVSAFELAKVYGTPLLAIDYGVLDRAVEGFVRACEPHGIEIAYAGKALLLVGLAKHLKHTPLHLDVCSMGELATAQRAGFARERITLHGCGKTEDEIDAALDGLVGRIVVDNLEELLRLREHANERSAAVLLRVNTGIEAHTHAFVRTAGAQSKFGFDPKGLSNARALLQEPRNLRFLGLHAHIGSQIFDAEAFCANAEALVECAAVFAREGLNVAVLIAGGGFGVHTSAGDDALLDVEATMRAIAQTVRNQARRWGIPEPRIGVEPGRALIADAGTTLYTVMAVKREFERPYAIVDGGIYENPRPALYGARHRIVTASREGGPGIEMTVCGRSCENDELGTAVLPADLQAGELLAMHTTGAYTYSMASNYNRFTRPAVVAARQGTHALLARRETVDDLLDGDGSE